MKQLVILGAFGVLTGMASAAKPAGSAQDAKWDAMGFDLSQAPAEVQKQAARDFQPELLAALHLMAAKGISLKEEANEEFEGTPLKPLVNPLCYLDVQPFLSVALPAVKDPDIPQHLSAQVLNMLICQWGGSHDSDGRSPVEQQLEIVDGLLPSFSETADKAAVSREALIRTGMESPMEAAEWLEAHPFWNGEAREKLVAEMLRPFYDIDPKPNALELLKSLKATNYPEACVTLGGRLDLASAVELANQLAAMMDDKKDAARVRREIFAKQGRYLTNEDYAKFSLWLKTSGLDENETIVLAENAKLDRAKDPNEWIAWLSARLPEKNMQAKLKDFGEYLGDFEATNPTPIETLSHLPAPARGPVAWGIVKTSPSRKRALAAINFHPPGPDRDALVQAAMSKPKG